MMAIRVAARALLRAPSCLLYVGGGADVWGNYSIWHSNRVTADCVLSPGTACHQPLTWSRNRAGEQCTAIPNWIGGWVPCIVSEWWRHWPRVPWPELATKRLIVWVRLVVGSGYGLFRWVLAGSVVVDCAVMEGTGVIGKTAVGIGAWTLWGTDVGVRAVGEMVEEFSTAALHTRVVILAGCFVGFTLALSSYLLFQHLSTYNGPSVSWISGLACSFLICVWATVGWGRILGEF